MASLVPYVALLRGVNVGGRNRVPMAELREIALELGLTAPRTLLQSGNLVFGSEAGEEANLAKALQDAVAARLALSLPVVVRSGEALAAAIAANPFSAAAEADPSHLLVVFLDRSPDPAGLQGLRAAARLGERVELAGREVFIHYAGGVADSKLTAALIDRRLQAIGTARNWTTVVALDALARTLPQGG